MKQRSRLAQRGRTAHSHPGTVNLPVTRASTVTFESMAEMEEVQRRFNADEPVPTYGMVNMPLRVAFEELMVELEGGYRAATFERLPCLSSMVSSMGTFCPAATGFDSPISIM